MPTAEAAPLLGSWVQNQLKLRIFVRCAFVFCVDSRLCEELISRPEDSYRVCMGVCLYVYVACEYVFVYECFCV